MIEIALTAVAVAALAAWILRPLLQKKPSVSPEDDGRPAALVEAKQAIYRSILDLELDMATGKVSEPDFYALKGQHEAEALEILREMDRLAPSLTSSDDLLEAEIAAARRHLHEK